MSARHLILISHLGLIAVLAMWQWRFSTMPTSIVPVWLALLFGPLLLALPGVWRGKVYTYKWLTLFVWFYFAYGVTAAYSDALVRIPALIVTALSLSLFVGCIAAIKQRRRD